MSEGVPLVRVEVSLSDDPECGIGVALFVAGCPRRCPGCQNPELQNADGVELLRVASIQAELVRFLDQAANMIDCVVFLGGDWAMYPAQYTELATWVRSRGLRTVLYTGDTYEMLPESVRKASTWVIDGPWLRGQPGIYPPSTNQRVFHDGELVDPVELPLYRHLADQAGRNRE
jgi:anaerobic ribonucleoside-triphosphate reductase activating protein